MNKKELAFWTDEMKTLDRLYRGRMADWQRLVDLYDLQFDERIRDLQPSDIVRVSRFIRLSGRLSARLPFGIPSNFS